MLKAGLAFALAVGGSLLLMPLAIAVGVRLNLVVRPRLFGKRQVSVPFIGGLVIAGSCGAAFIAATGIPAGMRALTVGAVCVLILGFADDRMTKLSMPPLVRMVLQFFVACGAWWGGFRSDTGGVLGGVGTVLFLVSAMNAFNLLDNMDGVAGWTAAATAGGVAGLALLVDQFLLGAFAAGLCGACLGFLRYNFPNARVYLGNGGSLLIGFLIGALILKLRPPLEPPGGLLAIVALSAVPVLDTSVAIISRLLHGRPVMEGGVDHVSHRLVRAGLSKRNAALAHGLAAAAAAGLVAIAVVTDAPAILSGGIVVFAAAGLWLLSVRIYEDPHRGWVRRVFVVMGLAVIASFFMAAPPVLAGRTTLELARASMFRGASAVRNFQFEQAEKAFASAEEEVEKARNHLRSPLTWPAALLPVVGDNLKGARALADGASYLILAGRQGADALETLSTGDEGELVSFQKGRLSLKPIIDARSALGDALLSARLGLSGAESSARFLSPPLAAARGRFLKQSRQALAGFQKAAQTSEVLPALMGAEGPRTYFLMIQDPSEQRATGGSLAAFGIIRADRGQLILERFDSNMSLPAGPAVPPPSKEFAERYETFGSQRLWQNVNMTPHFPTAARLVADIWESRTTQRIDGVMAVDAVALSRLLTVVGPIRVPDWPSPLWSGNLLRVALNEAYLRGPDQPGRADFLVGPGREIWSRLLNREATDVRALAGVMGASFSEKHMQLWTRHEEPALARLGIDGRLEDAGDRDYLLAVGQNANASKVDFYTRRNLDYEVSIADDGRVSGRAAVTVKNGTPSSNLPANIAGLNSTPPHPPGFNRSYFSLYLKGGTVVSDATVDGTQTSVQRHVEKGHNVISHFVEAPAGRSTRFEATLRPPMEAGGQYRLIVQKQPGLSDEFFRLSIRLPPGAVLKEMTAGMRQDGEIVTWQGPLSADKEFIVSYGTSVWDRVRSLAGAVLAGQNQAETRQR